jgi:hypothetical protein
VAPVVGGGGEIERWDGGARARGLGEVKREGMRMDGGAPGRRGGRGRRVGVVSGFRVGLSGFVCQCGGGGIKLEK